MTPLIGNGILFNGDDIPFVSVFADLQVAVIFQEVWETLVKQLIKNFFRIVKLQ